MKTHRANPLLPLLLVLVAGSATNVHGDSVPRDNDGGPPSPALVSLTGPATAVVGDEFSASLTIDVTGVSGPCGAGSGAVLGGYVVPVLFDPHELSFVGASSCSSPQFSATPTTTDPATANATGQVIVTADQTDTSAPTGASCVATLSFRAVGTGSTKLGPGGAISLSSAFQTCSGVLADPVRLPVRTVAIEQQIEGEPIPTLGPGGLVALALAVGYVALRSLRG